MGFSVDLKGKRALVTGASSGLGESITRELASFGARVGLNYHTHPDRAEKIADDLKKSGSEVMLVQADVSDRDSSSSMVDAIVDKWGGIDILVNNAGVDGARSFSWDIDPEEWEKVIKINLFGPFYCARAALKHMIDQKSGVILNITSVHETIPWSGYSGYAVSKAGLSMLTKTMAQEAGGSGVRIVSLAPGAIKTSINKSVWGNSESLMDLLSKIPLGRMGDSMEIARVAAFLVSDAASYITGSTVFVDGAMVDYANFSHGG